MTDYDDFLRSRTLTVAAAGIEIDASAVHSLLFDFQAAGLRWALRKGRAAVFYGTGLGKSFIAGEWGRLGPRRTLCLAPLAVTRQLRAEFAKLGIDAVIAREQLQATATGITLANYEMLKAFDPAAFDGVILDESSILKSQDGKTRKALIDAFAETPFRLCLTATPAPNDIAEIANHAEFLGVMSRQEMLAKFFVHDDNGWRLKGHAREPFYRWLASWALTVRTPSDLGFDDNGYLLPPLNVHYVEVATDWRPDGALFPLGLNGVGERAAVRKETVDAKLLAVMELIEAQPDAQWLIWCGLNQESGKLASMLKRFGGVEIAGKDAPLDKELALMKFAAGEIPYLVTKPKIAGFGMNFQSCHKQIFFGLTDSWETYYQAIRRSWRFGQKHAVDIHVVLADAERPIFDNVMGKEREAEAMSAELVKHVAEYERIEIGTAVAAKKFTYATRDVEGDGWRLMLGDSAERLADLPDASVGFCVFSPPFSSLYTYSSTERDLGNCKTDVEFFDHFAFVTAQLLRIVRPGRNIAVHVQQIATTKVNDGVIGLKDFRGDVIRHFTAGGFVYHGEIVIDKDPQAQAIRTHSKALLFVQLKKDAAWLRPALADYVLLFRTPGDNDIPIRPDISNDEWIEWARPIWYGIKESDTLQGWQKAKGSDDERHICPLQLGTIERCVRLWSNVGETVLSPFAGIGSEGYEAVRLGRRFVGVELKPEYFDLAAKNLRASVEAATQGTLFAVTAP
jgi:DNA modification methylase/superfamily II DNA or RNA helicase